MNVLIEGYEVDWRYTLSQWVVYYLANKYAVLINSKISVQKEFNIRDEENDISLYPPVSRAIKVKNKPPPKPGLKCHFCNLKYCLEEERKQHEEFWHSNKQSGGVREYEITRTIHIPIRKLRKM